MFISLSYQLIPTKNPDWFCSVSVQHIPTEESQLWIKICSLNVPATISGSSQHIYSVDWADTCSLDSLRIGSIRSCAQSISVDTVLLGLFRVLFGWIIIPVSHFGFWLYLLFFWCFVFVDWLPFVILVVWHFWEPWRRSRLVMCLCFLSLLIWTLTVQSTPVRAISYLYFVMHRV